MQGKIWPTREQIYAAKSVLPIEHPAAVTGYGRDVETGRKKIGHDGEEVVPDFDDERVAVYSRDHSYRCFHFDVAKLLDRSSLTVKVMAGIGFDLDRFSGLRPGKRRCGHLLADRKRTVGRKF